MKKDRIVKGIPDYILIVSIVTPVFLVSGVFLNLGPGSSTSTGGYDFFNRDWRTWNDQEWQEFHILISGEPDESDIPGEFWNFYYTQLSDETERNAFWMAYFHAVVWDE
jgi:hypothetical protein